VGLVGVVLAIYLSEAGLSASAIGAVIGAGLVGATSATLLTGIYGDRFGRRVTLIALGLATAAGYIALAASHSLSVLLAVAFCGMVNGMGRDRGAASSLEQAILPETTTPERRTWVLAWYNLTLDAGHAVGALAGATPTLLARVLHVDTVSAHHMTILGCAGVMALGVVPYIGTTRAIEVARVDTPLTSTNTTRFEPRARRVVTRLAALFGIDSLGGGFLSSALIAYWFFEQYGMSESNLAILFFSARVLNAVSHVIAAWLAHRIGLVNTMVFTHLPSSVLLMIAPAAPTATLASALFLAREAMVEMDVPTRQSYVMALVQPRERTLASSVTNVTRTLAWAIGSSLAGAVMQHVAFAGPLFIGGTLKIAYDVTLYRAFRHVKPPEE
jgi:MFS family permease